jgi:hypothetical protein
MTEGRKITRINDLVTNINNLQICIENANDADLAIHAFGYKDDLGNTYKVIVKDGVAKVASVDSAGDVIGTNIKKANFSATTDPGVGDDSDDGYAVGSLWINVNTPEMFYCSDASVGVAVWNSVGSGDATSLQGVDLDAIAATETVVGPELVDNGTFASGVTTGWTPGQDAALTIVSNDEGGNAMRIAYTTTANPFATQSTMNIDEDTMGKLRIRSDSSRLVRFYLGTTTQDTVIGTGWTNVEFEATPSTADITVQMRASAGYVEVDIVSGRNEHIVESCDKKLINVTEKNQILQSTTFTNASWLKPNANLNASSGLYDADGNEYTSIAATSTALEAYLQQSIAKAVGDVETFHTRVKPGNVDWCLLKDETGSNSAYFDLVNLSTGTTSGVKSTQLRKNWNGDVDIYIDFISDVTGGTFSLAPAEGDGDIAISTADGTTVDMFVSLAHWYTGEIGNDIRFIDTTTVELSDRKEIRITDDDEKHKKGLLRVLGTADYWLPARTTGVEFYAQPEDGYSYGSVLQQFFKGDPSYIPEDPTDLLTGVSVLVGGNMQVETGGGFVSGALMISSGSSTSFYANITFASGGTVAANKAGWNGITEATLRYIR